MSTLLQKARNVPGQKRGLKEINNETIDLALAWLSDEISASQIARVCSIMSGSNVYNFVARNVKAAFLTGRLKIINKSKNN